MAFNTRFRSPAINGNGGSDAFIFADNEQPDTGSIAFIPAAAAFAISAPARAAAADNSPVFFIFATSIAFIASGFPGSSSAFRAVRRAAVQTFRVRFGLSAHRAIFCIAYMRFALAGRFFGVYYNIIGSDENIRYWRYISDYNCEAL